MINISEDARNALRDSGSYKMWSIKVYDGDTYKFTIGNSNLVAESIEIDERLCSGSTLKFGLCEGSSLKFQYFGLDDISGLRLEVRVMVFKLNGAQGDDIPLGWYDVDSCITQKSTGLRRVTAYNKLKSKTLDLDAKDDILNLYPNPNLAVCFADIPTKLMAEYNIIPHDVKHPIVWGSIAPSWRPINASVSLKAPVKYGIANPFSYYQIGSNGVGLWVNSYQAVATLKPYYAYRISFTQDIEKYEQDIYNFIARIIDEAQLNVNSEFVMAKMMLRGMYTSEDFTWKYDGWQNLIGVVLTKSDGTEEAYSTIAFKNECQNVVGTFRNLEYKLLLGYTRMRFYFPSRLVAAANPDTASIKTTFNLITGNYVNYFSYYADEALTTVTTTTQPTPPNKPDGTKCTINDAENSTFIQVDEVRDILPAEIIQVVPAQFGDITLRQATTALYETACQFGTLNRATDHFNGMELNGAGLQPKDGLYPSTGLYPRGAAEATQKSTYKNLYTGNVVKKWRYLIITYKGTDDSGQEVEKTLQRTVNEHGNVNYNISDNWLFKNLVWTAEQIGAYADAMVEKMQDMTWFDFDMDCAGLPYLETGDMLEITTDNGVERSYILERRLKGLQNLEDEMSCGTVDTF